MTSPAPGPPRANALAWRRALRWLAVLAVQGAVAYYIVRTILEHQAALRELPYLDGGFLATLAAVSVLYGASLALPGLGWTILMAAFSHHPVAWRHGLWVFGQTLTAKYLPGNVFQFVGRHWLGMRLGWSQAGIGLATLLETLTVVSASALLSLIASLWMELPPLGSLPAWAYLPLGVGGLALPFVFLRGWNLAPVRRLRSRWSPEARPLPERTLLLSLSAYLLFLLASAAMLWALAAQLSGRVELRDVQLCLAAYGVIYFLGFVLPGAPGGLGVREALIILMLGPALGEGVAAAAAMAFRLATVCGEVLVFLVTLRLAPQAASSIRHNATR